MNRINPLYIALLLVMILGLSIVKLNGSKEELKESKVSYADTALVSTKLSDLKNMYADKTKIKKSLQVILKNNALKSAALDYKFSNSSLSISSKSMNIQTLNLLMGKVLNKSYNIDTLHVKRLNDAKVSLKMEIRW